jgi:uncharacterized protein
MTLAPHFRDRSEFAPPSEYRLLPFRFARFDADRYIATNDVGEYVLLDREELDAFARRQLSTEHPRYRDLKSKHFLFDDDSRVALELLAAKHRTRAVHISNFTALHMFVVTLRCDHSCHYCQVSRQTEDRTNFDMRREDADKALAFTFRSPSPNIKIEFQGGEPLLNFELIRYIVERANELNREHRRNLQFVIASNLSRLDDDILAFCKKHAVYFSTSLDGPEDLHTAHRPLRNGNSYRTVLAGIERVRRTLGPQYVCALMTTTPASLERVKDVINEYVRQGFHSIFLRSLSPYGFAVRSSLVRRYDAAAWIEFYKQGLSHILELNRRGFAMREEMTAILLQKMFSPSGTGYVDLQSPAGIAVGGIVYNYDGSVYASDEGRMLAEMGDHTFRLGSLQDDSYEQVMLSPKLLEILEDTLLESVPMCSDCPFLPFCGSDPVFHKATMRDPVGHKAFSAFCQKQMGVLRHIIGLLEDDPSARDIMMEWVEA